MRRPPLPDFDIPSIVNCLESPSCRFSSEQGWAEATKETLSIQGLCLDAKFLTSIRDDGDDHWAMIYGRVYRLRVAEITLDCRLGDGLAQRVTVLAHCYRVEDPRHPVLKLRGRRRP